MAAIAAIVFIALYFVEAGYGMLFDKKWGLPIPVSYTHLTLPTIA